MNMTPRMIEISLKDILSNLEYALTLASNQEPGDGWKSPIVAREVETAIEKLKTLSNEVKA